MAGLRAVLAVFRTRASLDRQQGGNLHAVRIEVAAMRHLRLEQQVVERLLEQGADLGESPVVAGGLGCGGSHGSASL
ncbi:hypothetical protein D9M71_761940 [compost metagenome]